MRGRSARPSQTRSRYRSKNSAPPILRHFSTTLEANWSMLYSVAYRRTWSMARLRSEGRPCSQMCWMHQFPNWPCATISMLERTSLMHGRWQRKYHQYKALTYKRFTYLILFETVFEDILDNEAASLPQSDIMPHTTQSLVYIFHNLGW